MLAGRAQAFSYVFSDEANPDSVTHANGYTGGTGESLIITVGLSLFAHDPQMIIPLQNAIATINAQLATTGNVNPGAIGPTEYDFESVILHELGHSLGLGHPNLGGASPDVDQSAYSAPGPDTVLDLNTGADALYGTADDARDDDVNLVWQRASNNNPFTLAGTVDESTYTLDTATNGWANVPTSEVANSEFGLTNTEAVMIQGSNQGETQRELGHDDVAGFQFAMAGLDGIAGNADDYSFTLQYIDPGFSADIFVIEQVPTNPSELAATVNIANAIGGNDFVITSSEVSVNPTVNWFYNQTPIPEPSIVLLAGMGSTIFLLRRRRPPPRWPHSH